jgi:hypothetical protein
VPRICAVISNSLRPCVALGIGAIMRSGPTSGGRRRSGVLAPAEAQAFCDARVLVAAIRHPAALFRPVGGFWRSLLIAAGLGGCGIAEQQLLMPHLKEVAPVSLMVESVPSGAEARIREDGSSCLTPCELTVRPMGPFIVDFALKDHEPQSAEVILALANPEDDAAGVRLEPNPLTVRLTAIPRPPSRSKPVAHKPVKTSTSPEAPKQATTVPTSPEPQKQEVTGSTSSGFYWPQLPGH